MFYKDQTNHIIELHRTPLRIVSLVPSQSEFLWDIGLQNQLAGITKFCIHPAQMFNSVERVGGTKDLNIEKIRSLKPDLIIANKEENTKTQIEILQQEFNVWTSDINNLSDALEMMTAIGEMTNRLNIATLMVKQVEHILQVVKNSFTKQTVAYFIWNKPYMLAAHDTFINSVLEHLGFKNVISKDTRYPEVDIETLKKLNPHYCFLSSEPFPFTHKHVNELSDFLPQSKVLQVSGELFSWYGSRLLQLPDLVKDIKRQLQKDEAEL